MAQEFPPQSARTLPRTNGKGGKSNSTGPKIVQHPRNKEPMLPANIQSERTLISNVMLDAIDNPDAFAPYADIQPADFYQDRYGLMWQAMQNLHTIELPPQPELVTDQLYQLGHYTAELQSEISLMAAQGNYFNAPYHADIVRKYAKQRKLIDVLSSAVGQAYAPDCDPDVLSATVQQHAQEIAAAFDSRQSLTSVDANDLMRQLLPPVCWVVPGFLPEGLSLLASKQKIGKSWLVLSLALGVALGGYAWGKVPVEKGQVLYLALEDNPRRLQDRIRQMSQITHDPYPEPGMLTLDTNWPRLDQGGLQRLDHWLREHEHPRLVIIDVLAKVRPPRTKHGDIYAEDYAVMGSLKTLADKYHVSILVVHHTVKGDAAGDVFDAIRDSAGLTGACDATMVLQRSRTEADAVLHLTGRDVEECAKAFKFKDSCSWLLLGDAREYAVSQERTEILDAIRSGLHSCKHIAEMLGKNYETMKTTLRRMAQSGVVLAKDGGYYEISSDTQQE